MTFFINNTLSGKKEELKIENNRLKWYVCGPTVYDSPHLGHARTYIYFDAIRRVLLSHNIDVQYAMNITDIDDKIIRRAIEMKTDFQTISRKYEDEFFSMCDQLNILRPDFTTNVSQYIENIEEFIDQLVAKDIAYESNGSVYFNIEKHLSAGFVYHYRPKIEDREENVDNEKRKSADFALWKAEKEEDMAFNSKYGRGRPGWHIECSAMATDLFGQLDIHSGGIDLKFPHHANEILQSEAYLEKEWVRYFLHSGHLEIGGQKMSKSLKNFIRTDELLKKFSGRTIRLYFLLTPYDSTMHFDEEGLKFAANLENKIFTFISVGESRREKLSVLTIEDKKAIEFLGQKKSAIMNALKDNFNFAKAIRLIDGLVDYFRGSAVQADIIKMAISYIRNIIDILGLNFSKNGSTNDRPIFEMINQFRDSIKRVTKNKGGAKDYYKISDEMREAVKKFGYIIEDSKDGGSVRKSL